MGMEAPISVSMKLGDTNNIFRRIVDAAQRPHLSIPVTEAGKNYQHYKKIVNRSLVVLSGKPLNESFESFLLKLLFQLKRWLLILFAVGAAVAVVGLAAYRVYSARRQA